MNALIWGASGGIGAAMVTLLKQENWSVFAAARNLDRIPPVADYKLPFISEEPATCAAVHEKIARQGSSLDLVVYAAGSLRHGLLRQLSPNDWLAVTSGNLTGAFLATRHSLELMQPQGHMFFIGAYVDHLILSKMGAYAAAKAALEPLVRVMRKENRQMRFTIVRPGAVDTNLWNDAPFKKPNQAKPPLVVAEAILAHYQADNAGDLNL